MNVETVMKNAMTCKESVEKLQKIGVSTINSYYFAKTILGAKEIKEIKIKKDVVDPDDVEMLEDLILTCVNEALKKVDSAQAQSMGKFNIPGIM